MRKYLFLSLVSLLLLVLLPSAHSTTTIILPGNAPTTGSQLFFDDFTSSGFPLQWSNTNIVLAADTIQSGGFGFNVVPRSFFATSGNIAASAISANVSSNPPIKSLIPESIQFIQIAYRMQAFNTTQPTATESGSSNYWVAGDVQFGLGIGGPFTVTNAIWFELYSATTSLSTISNLLPQTKQAMFLNINKPMGSATTSDSTGGAGVGAVATGTNAGILYNGGAAQIDLDAVHIFTIQIQVDLGNNANDYVRYEVDNNGWDGYQQIACSCILGSTGDIATMYPFLRDFYFTNAPASPTPTLSQSMATAIDYVLVTDYVPSSLPLGQILRPVGNGPAMLPQPGVSGTLTDFLQFEANSIAPGNLYAGGMLLTGIISGIVFGVLFGVSRRLNINVRHYGLFFTIFVLALSFLGFYASILPIWIPVMMALITFGIAFGVIKTGSASGGLVPD